MTAAVERHADEFAGLLADWLPRQRWFGDKQRAIDEVRPVRTVTLRDGGADGPSLEHVVVSVATGAQRVEYYQLLIGVRRGELPERLEYARIGTLGDEAVYDAIHDLELTGLLLDMLAAGAPVADLRFTREPGVTLNTGYAGRPVLSEQSNTSLIYADEYILKLFRRLGRGPNPDVELHRALRRVGSEHIATPYAAVEGEVEGVGVVYGMLQQFFANCADGWAMAIASVRDLIAEADLRADEVGGDFAAEARRLGQAVAAIHADLATALGTDTVPAEETAGVVAEMNRRLDVVVDRVTELAPFEKAIRDAYAAVDESAGPVTVQRIHGDLHLGQALRTVQNWVIIDFEGEPARPLADRMGMMSPLRDVAGMLRSFDYAAHHLLVDHEPDSQLAFRAMEWTERNRQAFLDGYATAGVDPRDHPVLMRAMELDKAVYEVAYELDNRPTWVEIPLRSIARIVG